MDRRNFLMMTSSALVLAGCNVTASGLKGAGKGGGGGDLEEFARQFTAYIKAGTVQGLLAVATMQEAIGEVKAAKNLEAQALQMRNNKKFSADDIKKGNATISEVTIDDNKLAKATSERSKKLVAKASIHNGAVIPCDLKVIELLPMLAGWQPTPQSMMNGAQEILTTIAYAGGAIPEQLERFREFDTKLEKYRKANNMKPPKAKDSQDILKSDLGPSDTKSLSFA
jgi:hypothetical protein